MGFGEGGAAASAWLASITVSELVRDEHQALATVGVDASLEDLFTVLNRNHVQGVPVLDADRQCCALVDDADVLVYLMARETAGAPAQSAPAGGDGDGDDIAGGSSASGATGGGGRRASADGGDLAVPAGRVVLVRSGGTIFSAMPEFWDTFRKSASLRTTTVAHLMARHLAQMAPTCVVSARPSDAVVDDSAAGGDPRAEPTLLDCARTFVTNKQFRRLVAVDARRHPLAVISRTTIVNTLLRAPPHIVPHVRVGDTDALETPALELAADTPLLAAFHFMVDRLQPCVIVNERRQPTGFLSISDVRSLLLGGPVWGHLVRSVGEFVASVRREQHQPADLVHTCTTDTFIADAIRRAHELGVHLLVVVEQGSGAVAGLFGMRQMLQAVLHMRKHSGPALQHVTAQADDAP